MLKPSRSGRAERLRRWGASLMIAVVVLITLVLLVEHPADPALYPPAPGAPAVTVWVIDNGFHSDLALPTERLRALGGASAAALKAMPAAPYVTVGWGDAKFFADTTPVNGRLLDGLRALFAPDNAALIRFEPLSRPPAQAYDESVLELRLSQAGFQRLAARLDKSFTPEVRLARPLPRGPQDARYFPSRERFGVLHLCNHWTSELLAAGGAPTRPLLDTTSAGLAYDLVTGAKAQRRR